MADETVYETTIANYETVVGALAENTADTPYTVRVTDIENLEISSSSVNPSNLSQAIQNASRYVSIVWSEGAVWSETSANNMFRSCSKLVSIDTSPFTDVTTVFCMFFGCSNLTEIDTSVFTNVTNAHGMFYNCSGLTSIDTTPFINVTDAQTMFFGCSKLTEINTTPFTNVTNASYMFFGCSKLTEIGISSFTNVTNANYMFRECSGLTSIDTSSFINVTDAYQMFESCEKLTSIDTSSFINVTNAKEMFVFCTGLISIDTSSFINVTNAYQMFFGCSGLISIDTSLMFNVTNATNMFINCSALTKITYSSHTSEALVTYINTLSATKELTTLLSINLVNYSKTLAYLDANDVSSPYDVRVTNATGKTVSEWQECMNGTTRYASLSFEDDVDLIDVTKAKVASVDLSNCTELTYLDLSGTDISTLDLTPCTALPYAEYEKIDDVKTLVKGWFAKNCLSLTYVKLLQVQSHDKNDDLQNDTNALEGCTALTEVEVVCKASPSLTGSEKHYGTVDFENEVTFNGKVNGIIDDDTTSSEKAWSSEKVSGALSKVSVKKISQFSNNDYWYKYSVTGSGMCSFYYEGQDTTTFKLPSPYVFIQVQRFTPSRGVAIAIDWRNGVSPRMWINHLHDDTYNDDWGTWQQVL